MNFSEIKAPRLSHQDITNAAFSFRKQYWGERPSPFNVLEIVDLDLGIDILPLPGLERLCGSSSFITSDWKKIYIDHDQYMDERYDKRTNFCVAHEIGHMQLHRSIFEELKISCLEDYYQFYNDLPGEEYQRMEDQAHAFAGVLLVPKNELATEVATNLELLKSKKIQPRQVMRALCDKFQVSDVAILKRIKREGISIDTSAVDPF